MCCAPLRPMPTPHLKAIAQPGVLGGLQLCLPVYLYLPCPLTLAATMVNPSVYQKTQLHLSLNICSLPQAVRVFFTFTPPPTPAAKSYFVTMQYCSTSISPELLLTTFLSPSISLDPKVNHFPIHSLNVPSLHLLCPLSTPTPNRLGLLYRLQP